MKRTVLMIAGLFCMQIMLAQWSTSPSLNGAIIPASPGDSFVLTPDTLWFLTGNDFVDGKQFYIVNPHNYSLEIQHIDQTGCPCANCSYWYTIPYFPVYPVAIPANDSIPVLVKFIITDFSSSTYAYDSLNVSTAGYSGNVIIAVDSAMSIIGVPESDGEKIVAAPNPFNDRLKIYIVVAHETSATVLIYNALMQPVRELFKGIISPSGNSLVWDGTDRSGAEVSSGVYFITIRTMHGQKVLKVVRRVNGPAGE